jgi:hypothetical protein
MIEFAAGEQRELNVELMPLAVPALISVYDILITSDYDPPSAADDYIHARIRNNGALAMTGIITARRWESWMDSLEDASRKTQIINIDSGEVIEYHEKIHGNDYTRYDALWWLTGDWTPDPLTPNIPVQSGFHLRPSQGDPEVEAHVLEVGSDYVVIRYAQYGTCNRWDYAVYTPPVSPFEQRLKARWYTDQNYCAFWFVPGLISGRLYEAHLKGGTISNREDWVQFNTL